MNKADWLRPSELEEIAALCRKLDTVSEDHIGFGQIPIYDTNGEELGFIESTAAEGAHFVPSKWRTDD